MTLLDNEGGEIRLEWIKNKLGQTSSRMGAYFYKSQTPARHPLPQFPGCFDIRARDKWPLAQGTIEALDVGNVILASPSGQDFMMVKDTSGTSRDPAGRPHPIWYKKAQVFGTPGDADTYLPPNERYDVLFTGSTEWPAQVIKGVPFMPAPFTPTTPTQPEVAQLVADQDLVITFEPGTSSNLPPGYRVNTVIAFTANGFGFTDGVGACTTGCGPVVLCQEEGTDGSVTVPKDLVNMLRTYGSGTYVRQNVTHALFELTDGPPKPIADRKRVDVLTIYCYNADWAAAVTPP